jgi:hypothetical protein
MASAKKKPVAKKKKAVAKKSAKSAKPKGKAKGKPMAKKLAHLPRNKDGVVMLSGGNPQIPKGYGNAPIQAYIAAMPGWKRAVGERIDAIVDETIPGVKKAVKWNSPFYGIEDDHYFLSFHVFDRYVKLTFFAGAQLKPPPPDTSKYPAVRYWNVHEGALDETQLASWVKQAAALPGEKM